MSEEEGLSPHSPHASENLTYQERQRMLIDNLEVGTIEDILPQHISETCDKNKRLKKITTRKIKDREGTKRIIMEYDKHSNIAVIRGLRQKKLPFFRKQVFTIEDYYAIDRETGKAWDVSQLWSDNGRQSLSVFEMELHNLLGVYIRGSGNEEIILQHYPVPTVTNLFNPSIHKRPIYRPIITAGHESAHKLQYAKLGYEGMPKTQSFSNLQFPNPILRALVRVPFLLDIVAQLKPEIKKALEQQKEKRVIEERNAQAFTLAVTRKLRDSGINLFRNVSLKDITNRIEGSLSVYDLAYATIEGPEFSAKDRRISRILEKDESLKGKIKKHLFRTKSGREYLRKKNERDKV